MGVVVRRYIDIFPTPLVLALFLAAAPLYFFVHFLNVFKKKKIIESVDSISRDERGFPLTQIHYKWRNISG